MGKWIKYDCDKKNNKLIFKKGNRSITVPYKIAAKYEIRDVLAVGGFGIILIAKNTLMKGRKVLIKTCLYDRVNSCFDNEYDNDREAIINKIRDNLIFECEKLIEFRRGRESRMPSIIELVEDFSPQIYGPHKDKKTGEIFKLDELSKNEPYVVMQFIDGINLGDYISKGVDSILKRKNYSSRLQWERDVLEYTKEICTILDNFHRERETNERFSYYYIYQDLKPSNIILTYDKFITLIDFGGLLLVGKELGEKDYTSNFEGGEIVGTPGYMAPEVQIDSIHLDKRTDIYTIGATMYSLLTGKDLTELDSPNGWASLQLDELEGYSKKTIQIIKQATNFEKNKRYNNVRGILKAINSSLRELNKEVNKVVN